MLHQDWTPVVLRKPKPALVEQQSKTQIAKKTVNNQFKKLEADLDLTITDNIPSVPLNILTPEQRKELIAFRVEKKLNQTQLANLINEQTAVINALETGKVVQSKNILEKINRILGTKLKWKK